MLSFYVRSIQFGVLPLATGPCVQMASGTEQQQRDAEHVGNGATEHAPTVDVALGYCKRWSIPQDMSSQLYDRYVNNQDAGYTWDWGEGGRHGS